MWHTERLLRWHWPLNQETQARPSFPVVYRFCCTLSAARFCFALKFSFCLFFPIPCFAFCLDPAVQPWFFLVSALACTLALRLYSLFCCLLSSTVLLVLGTFTYSKTQPNDSFTCASNWKWKYSNKIDYSQGTFASYGYTVYVVSE